MSNVYNAYEALVNGIVGAVYLAVRTHRTGSREMLMYGLEKAIINVISSVISVYIRTDPVEALDIEYLISEILAGLYHSQRKFEAGGDQLVVSILSYLISQMSTTSSTYTWFEKNLYGTPVGNENKVKELEANRVFS